MLANNPPGMDDTRKPSENAEDDVEEELVAAA